MKLKKVPRSKLEKMACIFATEYHKDQRYGDFPYIYHLFSTVEVLRRFNFVSPELLAAGWLHDTLEDTKAKYHEIDTMFGKDIAEMVYALTDELGRNRKERHVKTYPKLLKYPKALIVKLADRIANAEASTEMSDGLLSMYRDDHPAFKELLYQRGTSLEEMWKHLDKLMKRSKEA